MTIMGTDSAESDKVRNESSGKSGEDSGDKNKPSVFTGDDLAKDTEIPESEVSQDQAIGIRPNPKGITLTVKDKVDFIDSVVNNTRFTKDYSIFGGRIKFTVRSLTSEEVQALAVWTLKKSTENPADQLSGRYRKYLMAAHISRYNGVDMPPLEAPLFETLEQDGKTTRQPGWVERSRFWNDKGSGIVQSILNCIADFDLRYSTLCSRAEDENFWNPDTP